MALAAAARHASRSRLVDLPRQIVVSDPVRHALRSGQPVVALESTIVTHGLPYDVNLAVGRRCESVITKAGAVPATIALLDGKVYIGLDDGQLTRLAATAAEEEQSAGRGSTKTARRDLAAVLASGKVGGTTVSATAYIASMAGIDFFATGGIGGVHRGAETTLDISSDLTTLSSFPISLFCSGAKSILSLPLTLEYLETQNVPVYSFSQPRGEFPAFYTARSGLFATPVAGCDEAARIVWASKHVLRQRAGNLFAVPIPKEFEQQGEALQANVEEALREAKELGVDQRGKEVTPWLLKRVSELSKGKSLESNEALVVNNAEVAAKTAVEYQRLVDEEGDEQHASSKGTPRGSSGVTLASSSASSSPSILVLGCAALDVSASTPHPTPGSTSSGIVRFALGGVARNMAEAAQYALEDLAPTAASQVRLVAPLVDDVPGRLVRSLMEDRDLDTGGLLTVEPSPRAASSPVAALVLDGNTNDLQSGVVAMNLVEQAFGGQEARRALQEAAGEATPAVVGFDANLPVEGMASLLEWKQQQQQQQQQQEKTTTAAPVLLYEPTSIEKCTRVIDAVAQTKSAGNHLIDVTTPNVVELRAMHRRAVSLGLIPAAQTGDGDGDDDLVSTIVALAEPLTTICPLILVTIGAQGVVAVYRPQSEAEARHYHVRPAKRLSDAEVKNTTGAGDSFAGAVMARLSVEPTAGNGSEEEWIRRLIEVGSRAALRSLRSHDAVPRREEGRQIEGVVL